jgi:hypothetical protein
MMRPELDNERLADIQAMSASLRREHDCGIPVDLYKIINGEDDLELCPGDYGDSFEAALEYNPKIEKYDLLINTPIAKADPIRARFTLAHELGHFRLPDHSDALTKNKVPRYRFPIPMSASQAEVLAEVEADCFAANLLVPEDSLKEFLASALAGDRTISQAIIKRVAEHFQVSYQCAGSTVVNVTDQPCALAVYPLAPNRVPWLEVSESFERKFGLNRNSRLKKLRRNAGGPYELLDDWIEGVRFSRKNQLIDVGMVRGTHGTAAFIAA